MAFTRMGLNRGHRFPIHGDHPSKQKHMKTAASLLTTVMMVPSALLAAGAAPAPAPAKLPPPPPPPPPGRAVADAGRFGVSLAGLSSVEVADFAAGKIEFLNVEDEAGGLGPIFNDVSCVACHFQGGSGGASNIIVTRFGRVINGVFDPLTELGGPLLQRRAIAPAFLETVPREANVVARRMTTPVFGAGLLEAIPDATISAYAAVPKPDGIKGRVAMVKDPVSGETRVGRFGWKAQHATLDGFAADAYLNEMGVTSRYFPEENAPNGNKALLTKADKVLDPEDALAVGAEKSDLNLAADFMRLLAAVPRLPSNATIAAGEVLFKETGCAVCHVPSMTTGASRVAALSNKPVGAYSDLLLHDMGRLGDGIAQPPASGREMRTAPLWGIRLRNKYLHDGRAGTLDMAVLEHDGEAKIVRDRYAKLPVAKRQALMAFLNSL